MSTLRRLAKAIAGVGLGLGRFRWAEAAALAAGCGNWAGFSGSGSRFISPAPTGSF
jgi:hypothetical protein